jgi:hypothetical protein
MGHCHDGGAHNSGCEWKRWPSDVESNCECIEYVVTDSQQGVVHQLGSWVGA